MLHAAGAANTLFLGLSTGTLPSRATRDADRLGDDQRRKVAVCLAVELTSSVLCSAAPPARHGPGGPGHSEPIKWQYLNFRRDQAVPAGG